MDTSIEKATLRKLVLYWKRTSTPRKSSSSLAKRALAQHLKLNEDQIEISLSPKGKPFLKDIQCFFNISHSGDIWVLAVYATSPVGVDLELIQGRDQMDEIARRWMNPSLYKYFSDVSDEKTKIGFFLNFWTTREALIKCKGESVWSTANLQFDTNFRGELTHENFLFIRPQLDPHYCLCICVENLSEQPPPDLQIFEI